MLDDTGKLILRDEDLEDVARAVASVTFGYFHEDKHWARTWARHLEQMNDPARFGDDIAESTPGLALRQARAAIEAYATHPSFGLTLGTLDPVEWPSVLGRLDMIDDLSAWSVAWRAPMPGETPMAYGVGFEEFGRDLKYRGSEW